MIYLGIEIIKSRWFGDWLPKLVRQKYVAFEWKLKKPEKLEKFVNELNLGIGNKWYYRFDYYMIYWNFVQIKC